MNYQEKLKNEKLEMIIPDKEKIDVYIKVFRRNRLVRIITLVITFSVFYSILKIAYDSEQRWILNVMRTEIPKWYQRVFMGTYMIFVAILYKLFIEFFRKPVERLRCLENGIDYKGYQQIEGILKKPQDVKDYLILAGSGFGLLLLLIVSSMLFYALLLNSQDLIRSYFFGN